MRTTRARRSPVRDSGFDLFRRGYRHRASRLPNFNADYTDAVLTILRTGLEIKNFYVAALLNRVNLTPARLGLLLTLFLGERPALRASELGELLVVSPGNITGLVGGLVRDGLVRRVADPGDRRAAFVELTGKGRRFVQWLAPMHFRLIRSLMSGLSRAQARSLTARLDEVRKQVSKVHPPTITRRPF